MPLRLLVPSILSLAFLAFTAAPGHAQELYRPKIDAKAIDSTLRTDWYGLYLKGKKIGYFRTTRARVGEEISESFVLSMKLFSFGQKAEMLITQDLRFENSAPHALVSGTFEQKSGPVAQKTALVRNDKGFAVTHSVGKEITKKQIAPADYNLADAMASEMWIRQGAKPGAKIEYADFDMQDLKTQTQTSKILSSKTSLVGGVEIRYFEVETESSKEKLRIQSRHDDQGRLLSGQFAGIFELRMESEEQAKNTEYSQDLFVLGMAKVDRALGQTGKVRELILEIDGKEGDVFEDGPRQSVAAKPGGRIIKLGKKHGKESKPTQKEIDEALTETAAYCISHPKVKELAQKAVGDAKTPEEKVKRIIEFVHDFVTPSLSANLPNIHDLMEKKRGDCKSYALLTANLCRASGVPAREVSGLLYVGDDQKAFGGHAWNEVVLDGVWVPVDASMRQTEIDAAHLSFGSEYRAARNLLETLGKLQFRVVEVKSAK
ncbi:MAG: transglutaminase-like domain-containing protein [Gemmataceae bacterium]|nr:transglutaminase-like domain-containing protein [Gemmataceae bacterium]MCI0739151.1 transglutaminase-like domain-containing protein [Gemmataceae bacterium]